MNNTTKRIKVLLILLVVFTANANFVIAQEGPGASPSEESDQANSSEDSSAEEGPGASNSTEDDQTSESASSEGPGASNSTEDDQTSNDSTPESSNSTASDQDSNTSYDQLAGSCSVSTSPIEEDDSVNWTVEAEGGNGLYSYNWSGDDSLSGTSKTISHTYSLSGTYAASVEVSSPAFDESENLILNCGSVEVSENEEEITITSTPGGSTRRVDNTEEDEPNEDESDEEELTEEEIITFLQTLTPQQIVAETGVTLDGETEEADVDTDENPEEQNTEGTLNESEGEETENDQLAAIGGINFDWLNGIIDDAWPILLIVLILTASGVSYSAWKKYKSSK